MLGAFKHRRQAAGAAGGSSNIVAPSIPTLTASTTTTSIRASWTYNAGTTGVTSVTFKVEWFIGSTSQGSVNKTTSTFPASQQIIGLISNTQYKVVVSANITSTQGNYAISKELLVTTPAGVMVPDSPTGVVATPLFESPPKMKITWVAPVNDNGATITKYKIEKNTNFTTPSWSTVIELTTIPNPLSYTIPSTFGEGIDTQYRVSAYNSAGYGNPSTAASAHAYTVQVDILTGTGNWIAPTSIPSNQVRLILVGGGGGGGAKHGAGGGGGGEVARFDPYTVTPGKSYSYEIGNGGPGASIGRGTNGFNTYWDSKKLTANGGGGGGGYTTSDPYETSRSGADGGSGGGGSSFDANYPPGDPNKPKGGVSTKATTGSSTIFVYGNAGAPPSQKSSTEDPQYGGGGGGATSAGGDGATTGDTSKGGNAWNWVPFYLPPGNIPPWPNNLTLGFGGYGQQWGYWIYSTPVVGPSGQGYGGGGSGPTVYDGTGQNGSGGVIIIEYFK